MDENVENYQTFQMPRMEVQTPPAQERTPDPFKHAEERIGPTVEADNTHELLGKYATEVSRNAEFVVYQLRYKRLSRDTGANVAGATDQQVFDNRRAA